MDKISILSIRPQDSGKSLRAFADVQVNDLVIRDFRIIQEEGQRAYVVSPQISWKNHEGKITFRTIITLPDELKWQVESAILSAYQTAREKKSCNKKDS